jgi:hypothetical protein
VAAVVATRHVGEAGDEEHRQVGPLLARGAGEFAAIRARALTTRWVGLVNPIGRSRKLFIDASYDRQKKDM